MCVCFVLFFLFLLGVVGKGSIMVVRKRKILSKKIRIARAHQSGQNLVNLSEALSQTGHT
jgi:hypothetical protein